MNYSEKLYCHNCDSYQMFEWDLEVTGKQVFYCPNCNHPHLRELSEDTRIRIACMPEMNFHAYHGGDDYLEEYVPVTYKFGNGIQKRWGTANHLPPGTKISVEDV